MMTWLCMCPTEDESTTLLQRMAYIVYTWTILLLNILSLFATLTFCWKYASIDFDGSTFASMVAIGDLGWIYFMVAAIVMRHQIGDIFTKLSTIYNCSK